MTIKAQMLADNNIFLNLDDFAEEVTYNGVQTLAIVSLGNSAIQGNTFEHKGHSALGTIHVSAIDIHSPKAGYKVIYNSTTWEVTRLLESDPAMHKLQIISGESAWS